MDQVEGVHIDTCKPVHHLIETWHHIIIVEQIACDRTETGSTLLSCLGINTTVDGVKQTFSKVGASTEELHLLTCLGCRHAAADRVVITPYRTHHVIILILDRACHYRDLGSIFLEGLRQARAVKYGEVRSRHYTC